MAAKNEDDKLGFGIFIGSERVRGDLGTGLEETKERFSLECSR